MKMRVTVWSDTVEIDVHQKSKTVWIASGEYNGKSHEVKRSTPGAAAKGWADAAKYHSN
ncbi:MAG: hypothetical protein Q7T81_08790 [Pseudolabrys sp.]|nr:hypothetical protein [Pseudolabrys sp.]